MFPCRVMKPLGRHKRVNFLNQQAILTANTIGHLVEIVALNDHHIESLDKSTAYQRESGKNRITPGGLSSCTNPC